MTPAGARDESAARAALGESWDANADAWTRAVREGRIPSRRLGTDAAVVEACTRALPDGGGRALDAGCGEGWLAFALAERGADVTGVDASEALVERARTAARARAVAARFEVASYAALAEDPALARGPYDLVACNFALLDDDLAGALRPLARRLAPGGRLVVQTLHPWAYAQATGEAYQDGWRTETFASFEEPFPMRMPWFFRTLGSWFDGVGKAGLQVVAVTEPRDATSGRTLSLLLECVAAPSAAAA